MYQPFLIDTIPFVELYYPFLNTLVLFSLACTNLFFHKHDTSVSPLNASVLFVSMYQPFGINATSRIVLDFIHYDHN